MKQNKKVDICGGPPYLLSYTEDITYLTKSQFCKRVVFMKIDMKVVKYIHEMKNMVPKLLLIRYPSKYIVKKEISMTQILSPIFYR